MKKNIENILLLLLTIGISALAVHFYQLETIRGAGVIIMVTAGCGSVWFGIEKSIQEKSFLFDNEEHFGRFMAVYLIALLGSVIFPMLPTGGWPYLVIFVGLMLFSNQMTGIAAGSVLLMLSVMLQGSEASTFFIYFIGGLVGITIFSYVDKSFKIGVPLLVSLSVQMVCLSIQEVLLVNEVLHISMFTIPAVNIMMCLLLLLILLKYFSYSIIFGSRNIYMDINDPECPLLVELKTFSKEEYYRAVHTAYLCDRIAKRLNLDDAVVKACGYYHRIGIMRGQNNWENVSAILQEYKFPMEVQEILKEYIDKSETILSKETVVLLFCDTVISSINYLFAQNPKADIDYQKIIPAIFKKKLESGMIDYSRLSFGELQEMKKILVEEKLYYDFLR